MSKSGFEPLTDGFSIQYSTPELLRLKVNKTINLFSNIKKTFKKFIKIKFKILIFFYYSTLNKFYKKYLIKKLRTKFSNICRRI